MRRAIEFIKNQNKINLIGAEVGVYQGDNALLIMSTLQVSKMYLIDPYKLYPEWTPADLATPPDQAKEISRVKLLNFNNIVWLYNKFENCYTKIPLLDFIYIDGLHTQEAVTRDIQIASTLVKIGGVISGHDYNFQSIQNALKIVPSNCKIFNGENDPGAGHDWWFINEWRNK